MIVERDSSGGRRRRSFAPGGLPTGPGQTPIVMPSTGVRAPAADFQPRDRFFTIANHTTVIFVIAALLSLLLHGLLAERFRSLPLAIIDPSLIGRDQDLIRIERAPMDVVVDDRKRTTEGESAAALQDLTKALLQVDAKSVPAGDPSAFPVDLRPVPDQHQPKPVAPDINLPKAVAQKVEVKLDLVVPFVAVSGEGNGSGGAGGEGAGAGDRAHKLLLRGNLVAAQAPPPAMAMPSLDLNPVDQRPLNETTAPEIDFAKLAGSSINIPQNLDDDFDYVIYAYEPKPDSGFFGSRDDDPRGYFRVDITARRSLRKLPAMPKDVVYLIDVSGSVSQLWVDQVIRGTSDALGSLNPGDRFNIVFFQEKPALFAADGIRAFDEQALVEARAFLTSARSGGYTDVNRALSRLLVRDLEKLRVYNLVLISDGVPTRGVMDTRELINLITRDNDLAASIYCVGVGDKQNHQLLDFLAYRNKGFCLYAGEVGQAANTIRDLASRMRYPIVKDIRFNAVGVPAGDLYPVDLPNLHQGETFSLYGRFDRRGSFTMRLSGLNGQQACDFTFTRNLDQAQAMDKDLAEQWAFWKLHHLYSEVIRFGETAELKAQIESLRKKYRLKTLY